MERTALCLLPPLACLLASAMTADAAVRQPPNEFGSEAPAALSLFESFDPGRCTWLRVDPVRGTRELLAEFPLDCTGVAVAWSPDASEAIVDFPGGWEDGAGHRHYAFLVDLADRRGVAASKPLEMPAGAGILDQLAFDTEGYPIAIYLDLAGRTPEERRESLAFEGRAYAVPDSPGIPLLAHAFRLERGAWRRIETVATTSEACDAPGTSRLEAASGERQGPTTFRMLDPAWGHEVSSEPIPAELFDELERHERNDAEAAYGWVRLAAQGRSAVLAVEASFDYAWLTTPVLLVGDDGIRELDGVPENAILASASRGRWLLLSEAVSGARPVLYDLEGRVVFSAPRAVTATFWP